MEEVEQITRGPVFSAHKGRERLCERQKPHIRSSCIKFISIKHAPPTPFFPKRRRPFKPLLTPELQRLDFALTLAMN